MAKLTELSWDQVASRKRKAEAFTRNVLEDDERADEIADEDLTSYAERRGFTIRNPLRKTGATTMAQLTRADLQKRIDDLEEENSLLNEELDAISELVAVEGDEEEEEDDEE